MTLAPSNTVEAEKIFSHEIGIKQRALDGRLNVSAAGFYLKNKNLQSSSIDLNSGGQIIENAGALENYGVEVEAWLTPIGGLNLAVSGAWQHARYDSFPNASLVCFDPTGTLNPSAPGATCCTRAAGT